MRLWLRGLLLTPLALGLFFGSVHLVEDFRGSHAWAAWRAERTAAGDRLDWGMFNTPSIPDAENYATHPAVARAIKVPAGSDLNPLAATALPAAPDNPTAWTVGQREDLAAWETILQTRDLPAFLEAYREPLARIEDASRRPRCRLPVDYSKGEFPSMLGHRGFTRTFRLRALVELRHGRPAEACADIQTVLRIAGLLEREPVLLTHLLRTAMVRLMAQPVWEGLADRAWDEPQLAALQQALGRIDLLESLRRSLTFERLYHVPQKNDNFPPVSDRFLSWSDWAGGPPPSRAWWLLCGGLIPTGWLQQSILNHDRDWVRVYLPAIPAGEHRLDARALDRDKAALLERDKLKEASGPYHLFASPMGFLHNQTQRTARAQVFLDQAVLVCALERYRLARHRYPETLAELCPDYLARIPEDVVGEGPYLYRNLPAGGFRLWSVGWDGHDDGGEAVPESDFVAMTDDGDETQGGPRFARNRQAPPQENLGRGDWIWWNQAK